MSLKEIFSTARGARTEIISLLKHFIPHVLPVSITLLLAVFILFSLSITVPEVTGRFTQALGKSGFKITLSPLETAKFKPWALTAALLDAIRGSVELRGKLVFLNMGLAQK